ncbi:MAG: hypothetical protein ACK4L7_09510, partial [Flavobacteriales bacterium]
RLKGEGVANGPWEMRAKVRENIKYGVDLIKTCSTGGVLSKGTALGAAFTSNQVFFNGNNAVAVNGGQQPRIYAPSAFALGSSCVHFDESTYPVGNPNELMTPFGAPGVANHWPGPIAIAVMQDIGWTLMPGAGLAERGPERCLPWPNPASDILHVSCSEGGNAMAFDAVGRAMPLPRMVDALDVSGLAPGSYLLRWERAAPMRFMKH